MGFAAVSPFSRKMLGKCMHPGALSGSLCIHANILGTRMRTLVLAPLCFSCQLSLHLSCVLACEGTAFFFSAAGLHGLHSLPNSQSSAVFQKMQINCHCGLEIWKGPGQKKETVVWPGPQASSETTQARHLDFFS